MSKGTKLLFVGIAFLAAIGIALSAEGSNIEIRNLIRSVSKSVSASTEITPLQSGGEFADGYNKYVQYALQLINEDRKANGLKPVVLGNNLAAQKHAEHLVKNDIISHWNTDGLKPYMRYTNERGNGYVSENIGFTRGVCLPAFCSIDIKEDIKSHQWSMVNDDAAFEWSHRDTILDPYHNKVNIGIAVYAGDLALVQSFENDYIMWKRPTTRTGDRVIMSGLSAFNQGSISWVAVFYDKTPQKISPAELFAKHRGKYDQGELVGVVLPAGKKSDKGVTVTASRWQVSSSAFDIEFDLDPFLHKGSGVYTLYLTAVTASNHQVPLTSHSIWID